MLVGAGTSLMALILSSVGCLPASSMTCPKYYNLGCKKKHLE